MENEEWSPRKLEGRPEQEWPPVPTSESLSYFFADAVRAGHKYMDEAKYRSLVDTAAYCLDIVPPDIAENVLYHLSAGRADPEKWTGTFNKLASVLWRPPVREHEVRRALLGMVSAARAA